MRQLYVFAFLFPVHAFAQPTILQEHLPQPGQTYIAHNDYLGGQQFLPTPGGPEAQLWDYSSAFGGTSMEEIIFHDPVSIPGATEFPDATVALSYPSGTSDFAILYSAGPEGFKVEGAYAHEPGSFTSITTNENDVHIPVPLTYGNYVTLTALEVETTISAQGDPAEQVRRRTTRTMSADAYGTIITPAWPDGVEVIRHRYETLSIVDSIFHDLSGTGNGPWELDSTMIYDDNDITYNFLRSGQPVFVMEKTGDGSWAVYYESEITTSIAGSLGNSATVEVFPNPTTGAITIIPNVANAHQLEVLDIAGQLSGTYFIQGAGRIDINTEGWAAGTYIYRCLDAQGVALGQGRFVVVR